MEKIAVVILNYKVKDLTLKCVRSVLNSSYKDLQIIVLDNNSGDGLEEGLPKKNNLTFMQTGENLGYSGGNNVGIKKALEEKNEYVFILNPDTYIEKNTIRVLLEKSKEHSSDISSPKIYFANSKIIWYAGGEFDSENVLGSHIGVDQKDEGQFDKDLEVDFATGAAIFVRAKVFEKIGIFDVRYFLYYEDTDFCLRAKKAGFKIMYVPQALIFHDNAKSTGLGSSLQDYYITRNRLLLASKFLPFRTRLALIREALRNLRNSAKRKAFIDFLLCKFGKGSL